MLESSRSVQPSSGSIPSKEASNVFLAQVKINTKSISPVHVVNVFLNSRHWTLEDYNV